MRLPVVSRIIIKVEIIVIKFPSREKAMEWYNSEEYKPIRQIRHDNAVSNSIIVDGV